MTNEEMRRTWSEGADGWVANEGLFDRVFAPVTAAILDAAEIRRGSRLLDVGCGSGTLLAAGVAADANVVGVDISPGMVEGARRRVPQATVVVGDAQTADLLAEAPGDRFDVIVSRFGVMFFADPTAAFANIRAAAAPDARMVFACWRGMDENPMFSLGTSVLQERLSPQPPASPDAPGPSAFADADRLSVLLEAAGWTAITVEAREVVLDYASDGGDGVEARLATILATSTGRQALAELAPKLGSAGWEALLDEVRAELRRHLVDGAVKFNGAIWLVSAVNSGSGQTPEGRG